VSADQSEWSARCRGSAKVSSPYLVSCNSAAFTFVDPSCLIGLWS
jgi:hypothetical protein